MKKLFFCLFWCLPFLVFSQLYRDFYGAGHDQGMLVTGSGSANDRAQNPAINSVNGTVDDILLPEASRFLAQTTLGYNYEEILRVRQMGYEAWIDEQIAIEPKPFLQTITEIIDEVLTLQSNPQVLGQIQSYGFHQKVIADNDLLRQRMAFAWSQILVSDRGTLNRFQHKGEANYYDQLYLGAFGNFREMLFNMTMNMDMGVYLSSFRNRKFNPETGSLPDENFAREVMQLFTIGIHELEPNGTLKKDANGNAIPTYGIDDVAELAKVFTGLSCSRLSNGEVNPSFFVSFPRINWVAPMAVFDDQHSEGEKNFLGHTIPAGQTGIKDVNDALDILFNHPNTAPFLSHLLIQHTVKSNPSPAYVRRVARVFANNGNGVRGDLEAVTKAIFLDPEARECQYINDPTNGKLIQPMERLTGLFKAFDISTPSGRYFMDSAPSNAAFAQSFNNSPSVFNFFRPDFAEENFVAPNGLVSPEFQILNSVTGISYVNFIENAIKNIPFQNKTRSGGFLQNNSDDRPVLDFTDELAILENEGLDALLDRLDILLVRGQLTQELRDLISNTIAENQENVTAEYNNLDILEDCLYYIMISPDYLIQL